MGQFVDLTGLVFGKLTAVSRAGSNGRGAVWNCQCVCGKAMIVPSDSLRSGNTKSCGRCARETHGGSRSRLYRIWKCMKARCYDPKSDSYGRYGARGVTVCGEWMDFSTFQSWAITNGYRDNLSIDRVDGSAGYAPDNCRWATALEQQHNLSSNVMLTAHGKTMTMAEWARITGMPYTTLWGRIKAGWSADMAIERWNDKSVMTGLPRIAIDGVTQYEGGTQIAGINE